MSASRDDDGHLLRLAARRRDQNRDFYAAFKEHACGARRVGWRGERDQALRFEVCAAALDLSRVSSVLDVGCGLGELSSFLRKAGYSGGYLGIDVLDEMVLGACARHPGERFSSVDILDPCAPLLDERFDLVVACGVLSLRVEGYKAFLEQLLAAMWARTAGALVVVVPSTRARKNLPWAPNGGGDVLAYHSPARLRERLLALGPHLVMREDFLPTDVAAYLYRDVSVAHRGLEQRGEVSPEGLAWLYLERQLPAAALAVLEGVKVLNSEGYLRKGQALKHLGAKAAAAEALREALVLDPCCLEARLELDGL